MVYNYLEFDNINKWPKDKKVLLLNLLGIKSPDELDQIKITTDYINEVDLQLNKFTYNHKTESEINMFEGLNKKKKVIFQDIVDIIKEKLEDDEDNDGFHTISYLYHFLQSVDNSKELKYVLAYISKATGFTKPMEFVYNEDEQFVLESILYSAFSLYEGGGASKTKLASSHERFVAQIEHKIEEKMSRTLELNSIKTQAMKELGYNELNENNASEVFAKIAEIQSRKVTN